MRDSTEFAKVVDFFINHLRVAALASEHTLRAYSIDFAAFSAFAGDEPVTKRLVRRYLSHLHENKAAIKTILRRLSSLRSLYKFAIGEKLGRANSFEETRHDRLSGISRPSHHGVIL